MRANSETLPAASPHTLAAGGTRARRGSRRHAARQYGPWAALAQYHTSATTQRCIASRRTPRSPAAPRSVASASMRRHLRYCGALSRATPTRAGEPRLVRVHRKCGFPRGVAARASDKQRESHRRHSRCRGGIVEGHQVPALRLAYSCGAGLSLVWFEFTESTASLVGSLPAPLTRSASLTVASATWDVKCLPRLHAQGRPEPRLVRVHRKYGFPRGVAARASCKERESRRRHGHCRGGIGTSSACLACTRGVGPSLVGSEFIESTASLGGSPHAPQTRSASLTVARRRPQNRGQVERLGGAPLPPPHTPGPAALPAGNLGKRVCAVAGAPIHARAQDQGEGG